MQNVKFGAFVLIGLVIIVAAAVASGSEETGNCATGLSGPDFQAMSTADRYAFFAKLHSKIQRGAKLATIEKSIPGLAEKLSIASKVSQAYWTDSVDFDELANAEIVEQSVLHTLRIPTAGSDKLIHVPAGMMHTYGYLFSQLQTSFGLKGKRWIESKIDERLGLPSGSFSPFTKDGEFLSNVTFAMWKLIPRMNVPKPFVPIVKVSKTVKEKAPQIGDSLYRGRLVEEVAWRLPDGTSKAGKVYTTLLELNSVPGAPSNEVMLLVYGMELEGEGVHRLVTVFPVDQKFAENIMSTKPKQGQQRPGIVFKPQYNLYIDPSWQPEGYSTAGFSVAK